jgi:hypothetical protein
LHALPARLNQRYRKTGLLDALSDVTVSTADIKKDTGRRVMGQGADDAAVAVLEPERALLKRQAVQVAVFRVRN